jgi:hypothetical protein
MAVNQSDVDGHAISALTRHLQGKSPLKDHLDEARCGTFTMFGILVFAARAQTFLVRGRTDSVKGQIHTISGFGGSDKRQPDLIINGGAQTLDGAPRA